ncbi:MAG TPA: YbgC/FadM family acyl-CoA thioesterase [Dermatophilaceae bacterium]|nr:YbgC/FadM family acyl-CoA thioesterase [Dermatophilaceae bacterium]
MQNRVQYKVYYEDTDALGVVYYANYFKYLERGRTEHLGLLGRDIADWNAAGYLFVVHSVTATFKKAARLGDLVDVVSSLALTSPYRGRFAQRIERAGELIVDATVDVVCLDATQNLIEFPPEFRRLVD